MIREEFTGTSWNTEFHFKSEFSDNLRHFSPVWVAKPLPNVASSPEFVTGHDMKGLKMPRKQRRETDPQRRL